MTSLTEQPVFRAVQIPEFQDSTTGNRFRQAESILQKLRQTGHEAYFCGGCVRDIAMGRLPKDFDIATSALPEQVEALFPGRADLVGKSFGVVVVRGEHHSHLHTEVATFRRDGPYLDGRRPSSVQFTSAREDVHRRDFTVNALFLDPGSPSQIIDWVGGLEDITSRIIRCVGNPHTRFQEDKLRMLRAVRFAVQLGFTIHADTWNALCQLSPDVTTIAPERVRDELTKCFTSPDPARALDLLHDSRILHLLLPEVAALEGCQQPPQFHPEGDVYTHVRLMLQHMPQPAHPILAWAILLHDIGKPCTFSTDSSGRIRFNGHEIVGAEMAERLLTRLRFSNADIEAISTCIRLHMSFKDAPQMRQATLKKMFARPTFLTELELHRVDCLGCHGDLTIHEYLTKKFTDLSREEIRPAPLLRGKDVLQLGIPPGPRVGEILDRAYDLQLENAFPDREAAFAWLRKQIQANLEDTPTHPA